MKCSVILEKVSHELNEILYPKKTTVQCYKSSCQAQLALRQMAKEAAAELEDPDRAYAEETEGAEDGMGKKKTKGRGRGRGKGRGKGGKGRGNGKKPNAKDEESEQKPDEKDNNVRRVEEDQKHEGSVKQVEVQAETSEEHKAEHREKTAEEIPCPRSTPRVLRRTKSKRRMLLQKANSMSPKGKNKSQENETKKKAETPEKEPEELNNPKKNPKPAKKKVSKKQHRSTDIPKEAEANAAPDQEEAEAEPAKAEQDGHDLTPEEEAEKRDEERKRAELAKKKAVLEAHSFMYQRAIVQSDQDHKAYMCEKRAIIRHCRSAEYCVSIILG